MKRKERTSTSSIFSLGEISRVSGISGSVRGRVRTASAFWR